MEFKAGDIVSFLNEVGSGRVLKVNPDGSFLVEREDGFEEAFRAAELVLRGHLAIDRVERKDKPKAPLERGQAKPAAPRHLEQDLHFEQLVDYPKNYSAQEKLNIQLVSARDCLQRARRGGIKRVILIHGVGQGRLREEVHSLLERMDGLTFYDASFAEYGRGATEVEFF